MKTKINTITTIALTLGALATPALAQETVEETPAHKALGLLSSRFNQVGLSALISGIQGDKREHRFRAAFDAEGALIYNQEFPIQDKFDKDGNRIETVFKAQDDRTQGAQVVNYRVSALSNGKGFVSVDLFSFKNTDSREPMVASKGGRGVMRSIKRFPELLSQADVLGFEWDSQYTYNNLMTRKIKLADATVALPLSKNYAHTKMLALVAGGGVAFTHSRLGLDDGRTINIGSPNGEDGSGYAFNPSIHYGLQYDQYSRRHNGNHFQAKIDMKHDWLRNGSFRDVRDAGYLANVKQYDLDEAQYKVDEAAWLLAHNINCVNCNADPCYSRLSGIAQPVVPTPPNNRIDMKSVVLSPSLTYEFEPGAHASKSKSKNDLTPVKSSRYGITAGANFALESEYAGGSVDQEQIQHLNNKYFLRIFKTFK